MSLTKHDIHALLTEQKQDLVQVMDKRFDTQEKRLRAEINGAEKHLAKRVRGVEKNLTRAIQDTEQRLEAKIVSERTILQIFFDQQLRKTNGRIEEVARQLRKTHTFFAHVLGKQADLEARVDKIEQQAPTPL